MNSPMTKEELIKEIQQGKKIVVSDTGFTKEAVVYHLDYHPEVRIVYKEK